LRHLNSGKAFSATAATAITYHAGTKIAPEPCRAQVTIIGAKTPKIVKAPLYTKDVPVERTEVGKISESATGASRRSLRPAALSWRCQSSDSGLGAGWLAISNVIHACLPSARSNFLHGSATPGVTEYMRALAII
jgi:hypothetical protein